MRCGAVMPFCRRFWCGFCGLCGLVNTPRFKHQPPSPSLNEMKKSEDLKLVMEEMQAMMEETQEDMHKAKQGNKISAKSVSTSENPEL